MLLTTVRTSLPNNWPIEPTLHSFLFLFPDSSMLQNISLVRGSYPLIFTILTPDFLIFKILLLLVATDTAFMLEIYSLKVTTLRLMLSTGNKTKFNTSAPSFVTTPVFSHPT